MADLFVSKHINMMSCVIFLVKNGIVADVLSKTDFYAHKSKKIHYEIQWKRKYSIALAKNITRT